MLQILRRWFRNDGAQQGLAFSRPLVILQSDDWGRVGVRDRAGFELLRARGLRMGEHLYDLYSLETADDVHALAAVLNRHSDSMGRSPCLVMNFCTANLDFARMREQKFGEVRLLELSKGLPGSWSRPGLFGAYREGIDRGVFDPALHGTSHCCSAALSHALDEDGDRARLLRTLWDAETPYIFWRMPWIGYEYWNPGDRNFIAAHHQRRLVKQACQNFFEMFGTKPFSACAPGYRSNVDTRRAWSGEGILVTENGTGNGFRRPHMDRFEILHLYRTIDFEPSQRDLAIEKYLEIAGACFARGLPAIISMHSINFHSTIKDFRTSSLKALDQLLTAMEAKYPELLYVNNRDLYKIVSEGSFQGSAIKVKVSVRPQESEQTLAHSGVL